MTPLHAPPVLTAALGPAQVRPARCATDLGEAAALPRLPAAAVPALNRLHGTAPPLAFDVAGTAWQLRWTGTFAEPGPMAQSFGFKLGPHTGCLHLDPPALAALLDEPRCDRLPHELRHVLLADALQDLAGRLEQATRLRFEWTPAANDRLAAGGAAAGFQATAAGRSAGGCVQMDDPAAWPVLEPAWALPAARAINAHGDAHGGDFSWLRMALPFRLGCTRLTLREIGAIRPGDIISVLEWATVGTALRITADIGGAAGLRLTGLVEGSRITLDTPPAVKRAQAMNRDLPSPATGADDAEGTPLPLERLDALEVALRFEVGGLSATLGELRSLRAGHVFDLGQPLNRCTVRILAHGNVLGHGHLVAVGDRLGVRVAEFAPGEL